MTRRIFTEAQIQLLEFNPNIKCVTKFTVSYDPDFKLKAVLENRKGKSPIQIFVEHEFNIEIIGSMTPKRCLERWRKSYDKHGEMGLLLEGRGKRNPGRPQVKDESIEKKLKRLEAKVNYLTVENEFLKKLEAIERMEKKR